MSEFINNPLVSVIVPTYKRAKYLKRTIDSILAQEYKSIEVIVVDDNNEGDPYRHETEELMKVFKDDRRVVYLKHEINKNGSAARNTGIEKANGKFIGFLDDDDFFLPNKIGNQVKKLLGLSNEWGGCCCWHVRSYKSYTYKKIKVEENIDGNYCYDFLSGATSMPSSTLLFRREVFDKVGFFDESFDRHQDWEFLVRFYRFYRMAVVQEFSMYMQVEGIRNYPSAPKALAIKEKFLKTFDRDIYSLSNRKRDKVIHFQWFDIACLFVKEKNYKFALKIWKEKVYPNSTSHGKDLVSVMFFLFNGLFPWFKVFYYKIVGNTLNRKFRLK